MELPVAGLAPEQHAEVEQILTRAFGNDVLQPKCEKDILRFYFGGPKSLLRLSALQVALTQAGLFLDYRSWVLIDQAVGLCLSAEQGIGDEELKKVIEGIDGVEAEVIGMLLHGSRACVVVELDGEVAYKTLEKGLAMRAVAITDLTWGHWKHGWGIEGGPHAHSHQVRARLENEEH